MDRFFKILRRINSVLFLLVLIGTGASAAWCAWVFAEWHRQIASSSGAITAREEDAKDLVADLPADLQLGDAETITGTRIQMFRLSSVAYGRGAGRHGEAVRNVLLLADDRPGATWLFPNHDNLILETDQIRPWSQGDGVANVLSYEQFDADSLSIAYRRGGELRLARISLDTFATLSDEKAADIPDKL